MWHFTLIPAVFAALLTVIATGCGSGDSGEDARRPVATEPMERLDPNSVPLYPAQRESEAPDFTVTLVGGEQFTLSEQRDKVVLLNIWATWCAPCHTETPHLVDLYDEYGEEGLLILGVSLDERGMSAVKPFMERYGVQYPMVIDKNDRVMDKYGPTMAVPTSYIIGKEGQIRYFATGAVTRAELEPRLRKLLAE